MTDYSNVPPEALKQLTMLGVDEEKAHEALLKYGNDIARAADFCFHDNDQAKSEWDIKTPRNEPGTFGLNNSTSTIDLTNNDSQDVQRADTPSSAIGNNNNMEVVLWKDKCPSWSNGWEQPMKRVKLDDTTLLGLKFNNDYGYSGPLFQALFHIPIFRLAILAYRPTRDDWGEVGEGYWNGSSRGLLDEYDSNYWSEFKSRPYTLKFIHEFQKLFGFLSLSQRAHGDAKSLIEALNFKETKNSWGEWEVSARDFIIRTLDVVVHSTNYRDLIDLDDGIPSSLSEYIMPFDKLLKSLGRNKISRGYQPEEKDEDVLCIPLEITPNCNTVYAALDQIARYKTDPTKKVFFTELAKILILTIRHRDGYMDNSFASGDLGFRIHKELYMDRYLLNRAEDIENRWNQLEDLKSESERINQDIRRITEYQGNHSGLDLLKGSIDYFRRKCDKARHVDPMDDVAQKTCTFLERILEKVEQKFKVLIERKDAIDAKIRDIFNSPDMKKVCYRLKAVLGLDGLNYYAYVWISKGSKTETVSSNNENGSWWKFSDRTVEETIEEQVLNDMSGSHANSRVYSLIYVNADVDYNFKNINDLIPSSLKEYVNKDNNVLDEESTRDSNDCYNNSNGYYNDSCNNNDYNNNSYNDNNGYNNEDFNNDSYNNDDYNNESYNNDDYNNESYNNDDYNNDSYYTTDQDVVMDNPGELNSNSFSYNGGGENVNHNNHKNLKIQNEIQTTIEQGINIISLHPKINVRFELFCIKLGQIDVCKSLINDYYRDNETSTSWDDPLPLDISYRDNPTYKEYVELHNKYKEITLYFTEGLERICCDEYRNALSYFKHAIKLEVVWIDNIDNLFISDKERDPVKLNGKNLQRYKEIDAYARACLKVEHDGFLKKIRSKNYRTRGLKDGLQTLRIIVGYIGASNCTKDELFKQLGYDFNKALEEFDNDKFTEEEQKLINNLSEEYTQPKESDLKSIETIEHFEEDSELYERYKTALSKCSFALKEYAVSNV